MRAIIMQGSHIRFAELADPTPSPGQMLVAPIYNGICGSDLHRREQMRREEQEHTGPVSDLTAIVPGHEYCAEVVAVHPGTNTNLTPGDRIVSLPFSVIPEPPGWVNIGLSPRYAGGLATLALVDAERCFRVPDTLSSELAALTEPISVGLHAVNLANRRTGPNLVLGCGPIGLAIIFALKSQGRGPIIAVDFSPTRLEMAAKLGADVLVDPRNQSPYQSWPKFAFEADAPSPLLPRIFTGTPHGINIFECTGSPVVMNEIIAEAPQHSHVIYVGICKHEVSYIPVQAILKELSIDFCFAYTPDEFRGALALIENSQSVVSQLITSKLPLSRTEEAFDRLKELPSEVKILIDVQSG